MYWRDLEKEKSTECCLCLCKSISDEFEILEYLFETKYSYDKPCCWENPSEDYDYRSGDEWRYWIPVAEINQEAIKQILTCEDTLC